MKAHQDRNEASVALNELRVERELDHRRAHLGVGRRRRVDDDLRKAMTAKQRPVQQEELSIHGAHKAHLDAAHAERLNLPCCERVLSLAAAHPTW